MKNLEIDVISDVMCPWCIIGYKRLEKALEPLNSHVRATINFHPFIMNPNLPEGGQNLWENTSEKYGMSIEESYAGCDTFINMGKELGFIFNFQKDTRMYNTLKAHELLKWAEGFNKKSELKLAMFRAYFTNNLMMDNDAVLAQIAQSVGLDQEQALDVIRSKRFSEKVLDEERYWRISGVKYVPSFVINQKYRISGAQDPDVLSETLLNIASE